MKAKQNLPSNSNFLPNVTHQSRKVSESGRRKEWRWYVYYRPLLPQSCSLKLFSSVWYIFLQQFHVTYMIATVSQTGFSDNRKDGLYFIDLIWMFAGYIQALPSLKLIFCSSWFFCINFDSKKYYIRLFFILMTESLALP